MADWVVDGGLCELLDDDGARAMIDETSQWREKEQEEIVGGAGCWVLGAGCVCETSRLLG